MKAESRARAVLDILRLVTAFTVVFFVGSWMTTPNAPGAGGTLGCFCLLAICVQDAQRRSRLGLLPRWDGLRDLGIAREVAVWGLIVAMVLSVVIWISVPGSGPSFAIPVGIFFGVVAAAFLAIRRHFQDDLASEAEAGSGA